MNIKRKKNYIAFYVNDFLIVKENKDDNIIIKSLLSEKFNVKDCRIIEKFLEMEIEYNKDGCVKLY